MSNWFVVAMGIGTVFFGLVCIVVLSYLVSAICRMTQKPAEAAPAVPAAMAAPAAESIPNRQAMIAAISAANAEDTGADLSGIRILSVKKV